jgi:hypothetical protein
MTACLEPSALVEDETEVASENNTYHEVFRPSHYQAKARFKCEEESLTV